MDPSREGHHLHHGSPHVTHILNGSISKLTPFTALILTIILVVLFLIRYFVFEAWLLEKFYGEKYLKLNEINRRGFVNHHIAGGAKILMLFTGVFPFIAVAFGRSSVHSHFPGSKTVTLGDGMFASTSLHAFIQRLTRI